MKIKERKEETVYFVYNDNDEIIAGPFLYKAEAAELIEEMKCNEKNTKRYDCRCNSQNQELR